MRQYTTPEQTAKLIELGFEKPKMAAPALKWVDGEPTFEPQYTIGELIEMLPREIKENGDIADLYIGFHSAEEQWIAGYVYRYARSWRGFSDDFDVASGVELIDALYDMIIMLKEEGVI